MNVHWGYPKDGRSPQLSHRLAKLIGSPMAKFKVRNTDRNSVRIDSISIWGQSINYRFQRFRMGSPPIDDNWEGKTEEDEAEERGLRNVNGIKC